MLRWRAANALALILISVLAISCGTKRSHFTGSRAVATPSARTGTERPLQESTRTSPQPASSTSGDIPATVSNSGGSKDTEHSTPSRSSEPWSVTMIRTPAPPPPPDSSQQVAQTPVHATRTTLPIRGRGGVILLAIGAAVLVGLVLLATRFRTPG